MKKTRVAGRDGMLEDLVANPGRKNTWQILADIIKNVYDQDNT